MGNFINLTNKQFGRWLVLNDTGERVSGGDRLWLCQCECGIQRKVRGNNLRQGRSTSCGCYNKDKVSGLAYNLIDQTFGRLTVLEKTQQRTKDGCIIWKCRCQCGTICYRDTSSLTKKNMVHSCGCYNVQKLKEVQFTDLTNKKFGKLLVIQELEERKNNKVVWLCQCDCGNKCKKTTNSLTTGNSQSCGCINYSIGEKNIKNILIDNNILFQSQYTNSVLHLKKFDFALLDNNHQVYRLIEFDGQQHYTDISGIWNSKETLRDIQQRDKEKNKYALEYNIPLVRIPYWERDNITLDMLLGDKYLVTSEDYQSQPEEEIII